jgi:hypothetical protein
VHGVNGQNNGRPQVWMYVPCEPDALTNCARQGFWMDTTDQDEGIFALRQPAHIQRSGEPPIADVTVFQDFPFTRLVKLSKHGKEIQNTIRFITARPLTEQELTTAKNGEDVAGPSEDTEQQDSPAPYEEPEWSPTDDDTDDDDKTSEDEDNGYNSKAYHPSARVSGQSHTDVRRSSRTRNTT